MLQRPALLHPDMHFGEEGSPNETHLVHDEQFHRTPLPLQALQRFVLQLVLPARKHCASNSFPFSSSRLSRPSVRRLRETIHTVEVQEAAGAEAKVPAMEAVEVAHSPRQSCAAAQLSLRKTMETMEVQHQEQSAIGRDTEAALGADEANGPRRTASIPLSKLLPCHAGATRGATVLIGGATRTTHPADV